MPETSETITPEVVSADWSTARTYLDHIKNHMRLSIVGQVFLGCELLRLKKELGFAGRGRNSNSAGVSELKTWPEYLAKELPNINERSASRIIGTYDAVRLKMKKKGEAKTLALFDQPVSELKDDQLNLLKSITTELTDGHSQTSLLQELKIAKKPKTSPAVGGDLTPTNEASDGTPKEETTLRQLALALFTDPTQQLCRLRANSDYEKALHALPLHSSDETTVTLQALEHHHSSILADIQKAKAAAEREQTEALEV